MEEIPGCDSSLGFDETGRPFLLALWSIIKKQDKERGSLFHSSHNDIPIKQSQSQLITGMACTGKQIPRHETGSVERYPALRKKTLQRFRLFLPAVFHLPSLFSEKMCMIRNREGGWRNEEQERAVANLFDCQLSIQEVSNGPCGSQGQRSQTPGVLLNNGEGTRVQNLCKTKQIFIFFEPCSASSIKPPLTL